MKLCDIKYYRINENEQVLFLCVRILVLNHFQMNSHQNTYKKEQYYINTFRPTKHCRPNQGLLFVYQKHINKWKKYWIFII